MPRLDIEQSHSEEVQDIMGHIPHWIIRWGITLLFSTLFGILVASYFFKYPVMVEAPLLITTLNSPAPIVSREGGRIEKWFKMDKEMVLQGEPVVLFEAEANLEDLLILEEWTSNLDIMPNEIALTAPPNNLSLGALTDSFYEFKKVLSQAKSYLTHNTYSKDQEFLLSQMQKKEEFLKQMQQHRKVKTAEFSILQEKYIRDSTYYFKGGYGISKTDYDGAVLTFLQQKAAFIQYNATFNENEVAIINLKQELENLSSTHQQKINDLMVDLRDQKQALLQAIKSWKSRYILTTPISGQLTQTEFWSSKQTVASGQTLATIVPQEKTEIICRASIDGAALGKVEVGQKVNIKLSGFPYLEYGYLVGHVKSISLVPVEQKYIVQISLENGMSSTYEQPLKFIQEMDGVAEIITEDTRLIYKLIGSLEQYLK